jgi:DNA-binding transcriptional LysR family regulator
VSTPVTPSIVPKTFGTMQLGDAIVSFSVKHPNIALSILLEDPSFRAQEFIDRGYDLALRYSSIQPLLRHPRSCSDCERPRASTAAPPPGPQCLRLAATRR